MMQILGIEIGGTKLQIVVADRPPTILKRWRIHVDRTGGANGIRHQLESCLKECLRSEGRPAAVGLGFGGPVNWQEGAIACSHQIEGWSGFPLRQWIQEIVTAPVFVDNDANVAALGEAIHGAGRSFNPVFYVTLGSGVGGGLVVNREIYHGAFPGESEIGHIRLNRNADTVESRCSGWAMDRKLRKFCETHRDSRLAALVSSFPGAEAKGLSAALAEQNADAQRLLTETAEDLAFGLSHVVHLMHPAVIILGGGLSLIGEPLRHAVQTAIGPMIMEVFRPGPTIKMAELNEDMVPVGALELASRGLQSVPMARSSS
ncbi:MAG TPA: ROK family protein [Candidatus Paceibacterota bacterium]|nr:ROK family protein [Verrucomicrobiota bacterium]HRY47895.1 ROK family protein [Candidatus Paceibacterota bacterium]HSA02778.1 ROK family protein [Candidatus Paceibacterota bacterium]